MENSTAYISITSDNNNFELSCIFDDENKLYKRPSLSWQRYNEGTITSFGYWDNEKYLKKLFKSLKRGEKDWRTKELKEFCKKHDLNHKEVKEDLLEVYKRSKKLNMWK